MTVLTGTHENKAILMVSVLEEKKTSYFFQRAVWGRHTGTWLKQIRVFVFLSSKK